jgi:hypothetical protein
MINGFYGNTYETLPRENGFIYLKPVRILSDFISYLSDSNVILKGDEVEQLLLESVLENHNLLAIRSNYKSQLNLVTVLICCF